MSAPLPCACVHAPEQHRGDGCEVIGCGCTSTDARRWPQYARVLVCGSRELDGPALLLVVKQLLQRFGARSVVHGGQRGIDFLAGVAADQLGLPSRAFPVSDEEWKRIGKPAGPRRNKQMLDEGVPDLAVAIHDDWRMGRGTRNMAIQALAANVPVWFEWVGKYGQRSGRFIDEVPR